MSIYGPPKTKWQPDKQLMPVAFVAVIQNDTGLRFNVYTTGDKAWYLFKPLGPDNCEGILDFPVRKSQLKTNIRDMLAAGCGNVTI